MRLIRRFPFVIPDAIALQWVSWHEDLLWKRRMRKIGIWTDCFHCFLAIGIALITLSFSMLMIRSLESMTATWPVVGVVGIFSLVAAYMAKAMRDISDRSPIEQAMHPHICHPSLKKATVRGFEEELAADRSKDKREFAERAEDLFLGGELDFQTYHYHDAIAKYRESVEAFPTMSAYLNLGLCLHMISELSESVEAYLPGLEIAREKQEKELERALLDNIGIVYVDLGKKDEFLKVSGQSAQIYRAMAGLPKWTAKEPQEGSGYDNKERLKRQLDRYRKIYERIRLVGDLSSQAFALSSLAHYPSLLENGQQEALEYRKKVLELHRAAGNLLGEAGALSRLGFAYSYAGEVATALAYLQESLQIHERIGNRQGQAEALCKIGDVYRSHGEPGQSRKYYEQAIEIHDKVGSRFLQANRLWMMSFLYEEPGQSKERFSCLKQSLELRREMGWPQALAPSLLELGKLFRKEGKLEDALEYHREALEISRRIKDTFCEARALFEIGTIYIEQGKKGEALELLKRARSIPQNIGGEIQFLQEIEEKITELSQDGA
jgi:tetratricopeptide (TPR) repeat protein